ncbi:MAG: hypothetical protein M0R80_02405 [Proteobacteria bacterium]|jgi:hypothetical protein|nr:hypothetical protein [Pseudomonadota bacterium]
MKFSIWLETRSIENLKKTILVSLFPTLDSHQQEDNLVLTMDTLDQDLIDSMLDNGNVKEYLGERNPHQFLQSKKGITVQQFVDWLASGQAATV